MEKRIPTADEFLKAQKYFKERGIDCSIRLDYESLHLDDVGNEQNSIEVSHDEVIYRAQLYDEHNAPQKTDEEMWTEQLKGRTIVKVERMADMDAEYLGWYSRPVVITLDDGTRLIPQSDDEGNDGGAMQIIDELGAELMYVKR